MHRGLAQQFSDGTPVTLTLLSGSNLEAPVEWKSPLIDAESETVKIVVVYDNAEGKISSGEYCTLTPANERLTKSDEESDSSHTIFKSIRATRNSD